MTLLLVLTSLILISIAVWQLTKILELSKPVDYNNDEVATDKEALKAFHDLSRIEGIMPALETSHALAWVSKNAKKLKKSDIVVVNLSGRGDKDMQSVAKADGINF